MLSAIAVLAACCAVIGLAPILVAPVLGQALSAWAPNLAGARAALTILAPLDWITGMALALAGTLLAGGLLLQLSLRRNGVEHGATWGCGYLAPTPRIQYTSSSFAQMLVWLFAWALRPRTHRPPALPLFPGPTRFHSEVLDPVLDEAVLPAVDGGAWLFGKLRVFQQGSIQAYLLYVFAGMIVLLLWR
jgi:hydrogenase-4 component B